MCSCSAVQGFAASWLRVGFVCIVKQLQLLMWAGRTAHSIRLAYYYTTRMLANLHVYVCVGIIAAA